MKKRAHIRLKLHHLTCWMVACWLLTLSGPKAQCPGTTAELYGITHSFEEGQFKTVANQRECLKQLYEATKPGASVTNELLSVAESFMHLYILSNLAIDRPREAQLATVMLLERFPMHKVDPNMDPPQFALLLDSLVPYPANNFGVFAGINRSMVQEAAPQNVYQDITAGGAQRMGPLLHNLRRISLGFEWQSHIAYRHALITGIGLQALAYNTQFASRDFQRSDAKEGDWQLALYDKYNFLQVPLAYQYRIPLMRHNVHRHTWLAISGGVMGSLLVHGNSEMLTTEWLIEDGSDLVTKERHYTITSPLNRRNLLGGGFLGAISYQVDEEKFSYFLRFGGQIALQQMRRSGTEYEDAFQDFIWQYHLSDQNFKLHSLQFTIGILFCNSYHIKNLLHQ